jgi:hypothetical protein
MKWVTREFVHVDRTAIPWLIKKFIDPKAEFIFVPVERIDEVVKKDNAIPYDAPGMELGHHGEKCSFEAVIAKFDIKDPAVLELAKIVRAADTSHFEAAPEAQGLEAVISGFSMYAKDDYEAILNAIPAYEAFYTNCKMKLIRAKFKADIEKMDRKHQREFLKKKLMD